MTSIVKIFICSILLFSGAAFAEPGADNIFREGQDYQPFCLVEKIVGDIETLRVWDGDQKKLELRFALGYETLKDMTRTQRHSVYQASHQIKKAFNEFCFSQNHNAGGGLSDLSCQLGMIRSLSPGREKGYKLGDFGCRARVTKTDWIHGGFTVVVKNGKYENPQGVVKSLSIVGEGSESRFEGLSLEGAETLKNVINFACDNSDTNLEKLCPRQFEAQ